MIHLPFATLPIELQGSHGRYSIAREDNRNLKRGYMSVVYRARDMKTQELLALKTIWRLKNPTEQEQEDWQKAAKQFDTEISTLEHLKDIEGIVQVLDRGMYQGLPWYIMEYYNGPDLLTGMRQKTLAQQVRILRSLVRTLSMAHRRGVVHRDLKPSNILLDEGRPVILDFGISKVVDIAWGSLSVSTGIMGTPRYMAPEQFMQEAPDVEDLHKIDIWTVGVLFYEVLVAAHPLNVINGDTYHEIVRKIQDNPVTYLKDFDKQVDPVLAEICNRALAKDKKDRYSNAVEMLHDLNQWEKANFQKCLVHAKDCIAYQHWQEAEKSLLKAHKWSAYNPEIKKHLVELYRASYNKELTVEWMEEVTEPIFDFCQITHVEQTNFPSSLPRIYHIHNKSAPFFIAITPPPGISCIELLKEREAKGDVARLNPEEIMIMLKDILQAIRYVRDKKLHLQGLAWENIYCLLNRERQAESFMLWGFGWKGETTNKPMACIRQIVRSCWSSEGVPMSAHVEEVLQESRSLPKLIDKLNGLNNWFLEEDDEEEFFFE